MAFQQQTQPFQATYGFCDSYFVESHPEEEDGVYRQAAAERERFAQLSRVRQKTLAAELSRATADEYQEDVLDHMETMERETMPDIHSIEIQTEILWFMRPYLLDFIMEAHAAFKLLPETLHLAVNLLDRYCSRRVVYKRHYQLVGCAALLIAAKYGDRKEHVPTIRELKLMCCSLYEDDMFTQMEWHVLQTLNWIVGHPTVSSFHQLALTDTEECQDAQLDHLASYFTEIALYHKEFIPVRPSVMARSSLALARCILSRQRPRHEGWSANYDPNVVLNLSKVITQPSPALVRKYTSPQLSSVAVVLEEFLKRQAMLAQAPVVNPYVNIQPQPVYAHSQYLAPSTPVKGAYTIPAGIITPPITPDKDMRAYSYAPTAQMQAPSTPTPPPSAEHQQAQVYYHQPMIVQPNFIS